MFNKHKRHDDDDNNNSNNEYPLNCIIAHL